MGVQLEEGAPWPGIPPGSPQTPRVRTYLENRQGTKKPAPEVFILESTTPPAFLKVVLRLLGGWGGGAGFMG